MKHLFLLSIAVMALYLTGCSTAPSPGSQFLLTEYTSDNSARVYVYRPKTFLMSMVEVNVFIDDQVRTVISNGTYSQVEVSAGHHTFKAKEKPRKSGAFSAALGDVEYKFQYSLRAGETYFLGWYPRVPALSKENPDFFEVSNKKNPQMYGEGLLTDIQGEFGVVKATIALDEIGTTKRSNSIVEPDRI